LDLEKRKGNVSRKGRGVKSFRPSPPARKSLELERTDAEKRETRDGTAEGGLLLEVKKKKLQGMSRRTKDAKKLLGDCWRLFVQKTGGGSDFIKTSKKKKRGFEAAGSK